MCGWRWSRGRIDRQARKRENRLIFASPIRVGGAVIRNWLAPRDVLPRTEYGEALVRAIAGCRVLVLAFFSRANASDEVERNVSNRESYDPFFDFSSLPPSPCDPDGVNRKDVNSYSCFVRNLLPKCEEGFETHERHCADVELVKTRTKPLREESM